MDGFSSDDFHKLMEVEFEAWISEALADEQFGLKLYSKLPKEFMLERELLISRLWRLPERRWKLAHQLQH